MTVDANGSCTITRATNRDMDNATLTATLHYNGHVATTVTKPYMPIQDLKHL